MADETQVIEQPDASVANRELTPSQVAWMIKQANAYLAKGDVWNAQHSLPPYYKIENGQAVPKTWWDQHSGEVLTGGSMLAGGLFAPAAAASNTPSSTPLLSALGQAGTDTLPSTTIGTGMVGPITGGTGLAGGGSTGVLSTLKNVYDIYNKASPVIDRFTQTGPGGSPSAAQGVGQTAAQIEQGRLNALIAQAHLQQEQDQLALNRANSGVNVGNLDLAQKKQALTAPGMEAGNSARGDILANSQDAVMSNLPASLAGHMPTISGGLRPSLLSPNSRALGAQMSRNALTNTMSGKDTNFAPLPTVPGATPLPSPTGLDTAMQGVAGAGGFLTALGALHTPTTGASSPGQQTGGQAFAGTGTTGFPGDTTSAINQMVPTPQDTVNQTATTGLDPSILEWLKNAGQGAPT